MTKRPPPSPPQRHRRWPAAGIAALVAFVMGQAFAYDPIEIYSTEEMLSVYGLQ